MFCKSCGTANSDGARYCKHCGCDLRPGMSGRLTNGDVYGTASTTDVRQARYVTPGVASGPVPKWRNKTMYTVGIVAAALATLVAVVLVVRMVVGNTPKPLDHGGLDTERVALVQDFVRTLYDHNIKDLKPSEMLERVTKLSDDPKVQEQFEQVVNERYTEENYYPCYVSYEDARAYYLQLLEQFGVTEADLLAAGIDLDSIDWNSLNLDDLDISSIVPMLIQEPQVVSADDDSCKVVARYVVKPDKKAASGVTTQQNADVVGDVSNDVDDTENTGVVTTQDIDGLLDEAHRLIGDLRQMAEDAGNKNNATDKSVEPTNPEPAPTNPVTPDPAEPVTPDPVPETPDPAEPVTPDPVPAEPVTPDPVPGEPDPVPADPVTPDPQEYYKPQEGEPVYEDVYTINFDSEGNIDGFESDVYGAPVQNPDDYTTYAEPVPERADPAVKTDAAPVTEQDAQTDPAPTTTSPEAVEQNMADESPTGQEAASRVVVQRFWFMRKRGWLV